MTFEELYNSIMEQAPGLTIPTIPKMSLQAPVGQQNINNPSTSSASTTPQKTTNPNTPQTNQQDSMNKQTNSLVQNSFKKIKDLEGMVNDLSDQLRQSQGLPPAPKKPSIMSNVVNPQMTG